MFIIVYRTEHNPEKRVLWNLSDRTFPSKIPPQSILQIFSTSIETKYAQKYFDSCRQTSWWGEDAHELFIHLKEKFLPVDEKEEYEKISCSY